MPRLQTTIDISAPPRIVREILLDFPNLRTWHTGFIQYIKVLTPGKTGLDLVEGDTLQSQIPGLQWTLHIRWEGMWYALIGGLHTFEFHSFPSAPNECRLTQWEDFYGPLSFLMAYPSWGFARRTLDDFNGFNSELKAEAERRAEGTRGAGD